MSLLFITLLMASGALIQTLLPTWGFFGSLEFPVLTGVLICMALHTERSRMLYAAVLAGLLHDAFCPAPLGLSIPFFIAVATAVYAIRGEVFGDLPATYAVLGLVAAVFETFYYAFIFSLSGLRPVPPGLLALRLAGGLMAGVVTVPLISLVVLKFYRSGTRKRRPVFI
jgi:rod shape-determining protein MreD